VRIFDGTAHLCGSSASDHDLLWWDYPCRFQAPGDGSPLSRELAASNEAAECDSWLLYTSARVRAVVLTHPDLSDRSAILRRGWILYQLALATSCQTIVNLSEIIDELSPSRFFDVPAQLADPQQTTFTKEADRTLVRSLYDGVVSRMVSGSRDLAGFLQYCESSELVWLRVDYIKWLVKLGGPFPRRQDLHIGGCMPGVPPGRLFVVSYAWASVYHPSPSGLKMVQLLTTLLKLGAKANDGVFFDYCSLPQVAHPVPEEYFAHIGNSSTKQVGRTPHEERTFAVVINDMSRLYAFERCEVIVLPTVEPPERFPSGAKSWGPASTFQYVDRGWPCSEYAIARSCQRIANTSDPLVQAVERARAWPTTVDEYDRLMDPNAERPVFFRDPRDSGVVRLLFFKHTFGPS